MPMCPLRFNVNLANNKANIDINKDFIERSIGIFVEGKILTAVMSSPTCKCQRFLFQVKSVLEYALWGPSDVPLNGTNKERELALQRWLDLERATILHGLVRSRVELSAYDECHLMFLVRSSAKIMSEASAILTGSDVLQDEF